MTIPLKLDGIYIYKNWHSVQSVIMSSWNACNTVYSRTHLCQNLKIQMKILTYFNPRIKKTQTQLYTASALVNKLQLIHNLHMFYFIEIKLFKKKIVWNGTPPLIISTENTVTGLQISLHQRRHGQLLMPWISVETTVATLHQL